MFGDMMSKLQEMQAQMKESKKRLDNITVEGEAEGGLVKITLTGNRKLKSIGISGDIVGDKEALEDLIAVAFQRALEKADNVHESEMQGTAKNFIPPNMPGM